MLALAEDEVAALEGHLGAVREQLGELLVGDPVEECQRAQVSDVHQIVAR